VPAKRIKLARLATRPLVIGVAVAALAGAAFAASSGSGENATRQEIVAERGSTVMPFDLDATTHVFTPTSNGGIQTVVADNPGDRGEVTRIRTHLIKEVDRFRVGDFGDPETIHGQEMPGVAVLTSRYSDLRIAYHDLPDGGEVTYRSANPDVVAALQDWFEAQLSDHGDHAERG